MLAKRTPTRETLYKIMPHIPKTVVDIIYDCVGNPLIIKILSDFSNGNIMIPTIKSTAGFCINWGDDTYDYFNDVGPQIRNIRHTYCRPGVYTIHITGDITEVSFDGVRSLVEISQWGNLCLKTGYKAFSECTKLVVTACDQPNLQNASDLSYMFLGCRSLTGDFSLWDVSKVHNMDSMFAACYSFNSDLSRWNVSCVNNMEGMFRACHLFDANIGLWDVSNVLNTHGTFCDCYVFKSDLSRWNVSRVTNMDGMFYGCSVFNSDLSNWNVSNVTNMDRMFYVCNAFDADLSRWDVSNVTSMDDMFYECKAFNTGSIGWCIFGFDDI